MSESSTQLGFELAQLVESGNDEEARELLQSKKLSTFDERKWLYHLGNLLHAAGRPFQASAIWREAGTPQQVSSNKPSLVTLLRRWWPPMLVTIGVLAVFYTLLFTTFPRPFDLLQFMQAMNNQQQNRSIWDSFWDTGRPSWRSSELYVQGDQLVPMIQDTIDKLLGKETSDKSTKDALAKWLQDYENELYSEGLSDLNYHIIVAKGLFNSRAFEDATSILEQGLEEEESVTRRGQIYQELGTTYYYQGYELQPDGLAHYDLPLVRKSVEAYEQAAPYSNNPYLFGNLGWGYYLLAEYEKAIKYGKKALQLTPSLNYVRMNLGITYLRMGELQNSLNSYENILIYRPDRTEYEGGIRDLQELIREFPGQYLFGHFLLGYLFQMQGNYPPAQEAYKLYLQESSIPYWQAQARHRLSEMSNE
jgi:tetratricopeptide (TPR) repeat protein